MSVNKAILVGNLGKDPEIRFTGTGKAVCKFPLATTTSWNDNDGQRSSDASHGDTYLRLRQGKRSARALRLAPAQG